MFQLLNEPHPGFIGLPSIYEWVHSYSLPCDMQIAADYSELQHRSPPWSIPFTSTIIRPGRRPPDQGPNLHQIFPISDPSNFEGSRKQIWSKCMEV